MDLSDVWFCDQSHIYLYNWVYFAFVDLYLCVIVVQDGSSLPASQRGYHPEELAKRDDLQIGN